MSSSNDLFSIAYNIRTKKDETSGGTMATSIVIDAGHGGYDNGAVYEGRREKDEVLRLALAVGEKLSQGGYEIFFTRTTDEYASPYEKAQTANATGADYFISLHRNSAPNPNTYHGVQTLVYQENQVVDSIANAVNRQLADVGFENLGIDERPGLVVLRRTEMPATLVEVGFINSDEDNRIFDQNFDEIVNAIAAGIGEGIGEGVGDGQGRSVSKYGVQVGVFQYYANAQYLLGQLQDMGYMAQARQEGTYYIVIVGSETSLEEAVELQAGLRELGYETLIVNL